MIHDPGAIAWGLVVAFVGFKAVRRMRRKRQMRRVLKRERLGVRLAHVVRS